MTTPTATIFLPWHALDDAIQRGLRADQPEPDDVVPGTLYGVTDEGNAIERSNGTAWEPYGATGGAGGTPDPHHATHEPGGSDALVDAAWTDQANIFAADQTVDGDLFVTGTVNPLTAAQRAQINALTGEEGGARTLMSSSFVSGLSLRHDEAVARGRIACGNYDTQTYQPLAFEVEAFEVHTGVSPASRIEHVRVHPLGGVTVGAGADHATDPGTGILRARGLDGTPLDADQLLSGTVPDARLSANVQFKPIALADLPPTVATTPIDLATDVTGTLPGSALPAHHATHEPGGADALVNAAWTDQINVFTQQQVLEGLAPTLRLSTTADPANARTWELVANSQLFSLRTVDDAGAAQLAAVIVNRAGDVVIARDVYEKGRAAPVGQWIDIPFNAGNYGATGGTWTGITQLRLSYSLVGHTAHIQLVVHPSTVGGTPASLNVVMPFTILANQSSVFYYNIGGNAVGTYVQPAQDQYLRLQKDPFGTPLPAGTGYVYAALTVQILQESPMAETSVQQMALTRDTAPGGFMERVTAMMAFVTSTVLSEPSATPFHQGRAFFAQKVVERPQQMAQQAGPQVVMGVNVVATTIYHEETQTAVCTIADIDLQSQILTLWNSLAGIDTPS